MSRRTITTFAAGAAAGVTACAALGAGLVSDDTRGAGRVLQGLTLGTSAAVDELPAFEDCEQLRRWYVRAALGRVGPYGLDGPPVMYAVSPQEIRPDAPAAVRGEAGSVASSGTGTNVQERDVDESDIAKTDGGPVFQMVAGTLVVTDVSGGRARVVSRTTLPGPGLTDAELVLDGDRVVVVGSPPVLRHGPVPTDSTSPGRVIPPWRTHPRTRVVTVDVSDPSAPRVSRTRSIQGSTVSSRQYADGTVRVVVDRDHPDIGFVIPGPGRTAAQATAENRRLLRSAPVEDWLPAVTSSQASESGPVDCSDVRHPRSPAGRPAGPGTLTVLTLDADDDLDTTSVTALGDVVYSSAERLYVATTGPGATTVHAFRLRPGRTSYAGSGTVPGSVRDRWSLDEHDGHLRVATALGDPWQPRENAVVVLTEHRGALVPTGRVDGLGKGEQIKSVRWLGDRAVVVTFRQTDPLYTLDLSDPGRPEVEGQLKVPGYSAYLHPVGDDLLLGLGHHATRTGSDLGTQAATFDLRDPTDVRRVDTTGFGPGTFLGIESDPRAFTYLPEQRTFVTRVDDWDADGPRSWLQAVHVSADGTLTRTGAWPAPPGGEVRTLPLDGGRAALVDDDQVRVVDPG
jgi:hypothetical protein